MTTALYAFLIVASAGFFLGSTVSIVPVTMQYYDSMADCSAARNNKAGCDALSPICVWTRDPQSSSSDLVCAFRDLIKYGYTECRNYSSTEALCAKGDAGAACSWDSGTKECRHLPAWSPGEVGIYASASIGGGFISTVLGSVIINRVFRSRIPLACVVMGVIAFFGVIVTGIAFSKNASDAMGTFWLHICGRLLLGFAGGVITIAGPILGSEIAPSESKQTASILFGPCMTIANLATALVALAVNPDANAGDANLQSLYWLVLLVQLFGAAFFTFAVLLACFRTGISVTSFVVNANDAVVAAVQEEDKLIAKQVQITTTVDEVPAALLPDGAPKTFAGRLVVGLLLSTALQFTGITAVMAFAPRLAKSAGLQPLPGTAVVMAINFLTCLGTVPISKRVPVRNMFIWSSGAASIACLFTGIPTLISDHAEGATLTAMNALIIIGVLAVVACYQLGMGGSFYVVGQGVFLPGRERTIGFAAAVAWEFFGVLLINGLYAPMQSLLSGDGFRGSSGEQRQGQGILFLFFGITGTVVTLALMRLLHPMSLNEE